MKNIKRKICVTTGTRSEYGLLRPVLAELKKSKKIDLILIVTGMHLSSKYGNTIDLIKKDGFKISYKFPMIPKKDSSFYMAKSLGEGIVKFATIFKKINPDINVILGDRDESFASAIAAFHMNIPNAHIHGGDRTMGGIDEYIRHAMTKISNIHFAASKVSQKRIVKMGENKDFVFFTGSPGIDDIFKQKISTKNKLKRKYGVDLKGNEILLLQHPVTSQISQSEKQILSILSVISKLKLPTIAIAPNSDAGNMPIFTHLSNYSKKFPFIRVFSSLPRDDYLGFLKYCGVLVGNSSSGMIEGSYFDTPIVNLGIRQKDREHGNNVINVHTMNQQNIRKSIMTSLKLNSKKPVIKNTIYGDGNSAKKIIQLLETIPLNEKLIQKQITY